MRLWKKKLQNDPIGLSPDEIFLDATNIPGFSRERFEGVLEKPISRGAFYSFGTLLGIFGILLFGRALWLQVVRGTELQSRAQNNYIEKTYIEPPRGIIYDRSGIPIAFNGAYKNEKDEIQYRRTVRHPYAFSHVIGFVGEMSEDDIKKGITQRGNKLIGKTGLEQYYQEKLRGIPGERDEEFDANGRSIARGLIIEPREGENIQTTLSVPLQETFWQIIDSTVRDHGYRGGAGIIFNVIDGSVLALVSAPSFDINLFSTGLDTKTAKEIFSDPRAPLFNRALAGAYSPGSIMKPYIALAALEEQVIDPEQQIFSSGSISVPNPYDKDKPSVFRDWKAHGNVNMRRALAVSSDVYFYTVGGGFGTIEGLGIRRIKEWLTKFGFNSTTGIDLAGEKTGLLPDPEWKKIARQSNPTWRVGDTYNTSIGQGDVLVTPLEVARGIGILATKGKIIKPHLLQEKNTPDQDTIAVKPENFTIVAEGMRAVTQPGGTATYLGWLPFPVAVKTGSAEVNKKERVNSWFTGYAPYDNPQLGMVIFLESGSRTSSIGAIYIASEMFRWILDHGGIETVINH